MPVAYSEELTLEWIVGIKPADPTKDVEPCTERVRIFVGSADFAVAYPVKSTGLLRKPGQLMAT